MLRAVTLRALAVLLLTLTAAPFADAKVPQDPAVDALEVPPGEIPEIRLLELTPKMAKFLLKHVRPDQPRKVQLNALMDAIFSKKGLGIRYGNTYTKTAAQTFESRSGNCLSFTVLFVAMARHIGLPAYFQEVTEVTSRDIRGEILLANHHMFAEVELDNGVAVVDFLPGTDKRYVQVQRIGDQRALAHLYNNLGAEELAGGELRLAVAYFDRALETDRELLPAWVNRGVALRRLGRFAKAESSYLEALALDRRDPSATINLAGLYMAQGRTQDAAPLMARATEYLQGNPYHHFRLGAEAIQAGQVDEAIRHLKEASRREPGEALFDATLGEAYVQAGDLTRARQALRRALRNAEEEDLRLRLEQKLISLAEKG